MPRLNLCVDDLGIGPGVSAAVLRLAAEGVLGSASVMANLPHAERVPSELAGVAGRIDLGLHFTLTCGRPLAACGPGSGLVGADGRFRGFGPLARRAWLRGVSAEAVAAELCAQWDRFIALFGRPPDHLDGHHHVHQLPVVRGAVVAVARERGGGRFYVRNSGISPLQALRQRRDAAKALAVGLPGIAMRRALVAADLPTNTAFAGVIGLGGGTADGLRAAFGDCLRAAAATGRDCLMMVHPAAPDASIGELDSYVEGRAAELEALASPEFRALVARHGFGIGTAP